MPKLAFHPSLAVGELLRRRRQEFGLTLREVEEQTARMGTHIPFTTLGKIERGQLEPGTRRLYLLLKLYNIPPQLAADVLELEQLGGDRLPDKDTKTLFAEGVALWKKGDITGALAHLFALRRKTVDTQATRIERQEALLSFAIAASALGKYALSRQIVEDLLLEPPDRSLLVRAMIQAAVCWRRLGSPDVALGLLRRADELAARDGNLREQAWVAHQMATTLAAVGELEEAERELRIALEDYRSAGDNYNESQALAVRIGILERQGDWPAALEAADKAREHAEAHGFERLGLLRRLDESHILLKLGRVKEAIEAANFVLIKAISTDDNFVRFYAHYYLWKAHEQAGDRERARLELEEARYYVRFVDEASDEADEIRRISARQLTGATPSPVQQTIGKSKRGRRRSKRPARGRN